MKKKTREETLKELNASLEKDVPVKKSREETLEELNSEEIPEDEDDSEVTVGDRVMKGLRVVGNIADGAASMVRTGVEAAFNPAKDVMPEMVDQGKRLIYEFPHGAESAPTPKEMNDQIMPGRGDNALSTAGDFISGVATDPLSFVGYGAGKKAATALAGGADEVSGATTGLKRLSHEASARSLAKNVTKSQVINEGFNPRAMGARIVEEKLSGLLNKPAEMYAALSGSKKLTVKRPQSLDTMLIKSEKTPGLISKISDELESQLYQLQRRYHPRFKVGDVIGEAHSQNTYRLVDPLSGDSPDVLNRLRIARDALKPITRTEIPKFMDPPPNPFSKKLPAKDAYDTADRMIPPIPSEAKVGKPVKGSYPMTEHNFPDAPKPPVAPDFDKVDEGFVGVNRPGADASAHRKKLLKADYETKLSEYGKELDEYKKKISDIAGELKKQFQIDTDDFNGLKEGDAKRTAAFKARKSEERFLDAQRYKMDVDNYRLELSKHKKEYADWKKISDAPDSVEIERELSLTEMQKLRQNIGKHLSSRAFYASPDKAMSEEKEVLVDLYQRLGGKIKEALGQMELIKDGKPVNALEYYEAQNNRLHDLINVETALESAEHGVTKAPTMFDNAVGMAGGAATGLATSAATGFDAMASMGLGAAFGTARSSGKYLESRAPGWVADGTDKLRDFFLKTDGQRASGLMGAGVQQGAVRGNAGREPQSVNIPEELIRTPLPRSTSELMQKKKFVLMKVAQMAPEMYEGVKDVMEHNPEQLPQLAQMLSQTQPQLFAMDKYNRFDGRIISEKDKALAIKDTLLRKDIDSIQQAGIITKLNQEGLFDQ